MDVYYKKPAVCFSYDVAVAIFGHWVALVLTLCIQILR